MRLQLDDGSQVFARIKGKTLKPVCADRVSVEPIGEEDDWLITAIRERRNELDRPNLRGGREVLAANVDVIAAMAAAAPRPDWFVVDRYLCAAELMGVAAVVVFNKVDLGPTEADEESLRVFETIGYETVRTSARTAEGLGTLADLMRDRTSIVVGQSGVGKSSIINRLSELSEQKTAAISSKRGEGRHTTVNSVLISLPRGGAVIDSPGVRDYAPVFDSADQPRAGFREVSDKGRQCRFANCRHLREPGCAVKDAVASGDIDARRYESYRRAVALADRLQRGKF